MLEGIRVLDLSRVIAGPYCAMMLADLGADVVKVERPGRGDDMRYLGEGKDGMSLGFATINRNKRGIAVDLQHPEGSRLVVELAGRADVIVENGGRRPPVRRPAPTLGQHTREVLLELGTSEPEVDRLIALGAIAE